MADSASAANADSPAAADRKREAPDAEAPPAEATSPPAAKRTRTDGPPDGEHKPVAVAPTDPGALNKAIKGQVEYYFSDANMKHDKFFQEKIRANAESWLNVELILSCRNIKKLNITSGEAIIEALTDSHLETKKDETGIWIRRTSPLPDLEERPRKEDNNRKKKGASVDMETVHDGGCLCKATGCPEEATWENVKAALQAKLPEEARIRFASQLQQDGSCYLYTFKFDGDRKFFESVDIEVCGAPVKVSLINDPEEASKMLKTIMPAKVSQHRATVLRKMAEAAGGGKKKQQSKGNASKPIVLGGTEFQSVNHLRNCVKELLKKTEAGVMLPPEKAAYKVVSEILKFHPKALEKTKNMTGLKVDQVTKNGSTTKCFFIVKTEDGKEVSEDFSSVKCLAAIEADPPLKEAVAEKGKPETTEEAVSSSAETVEPPSTSA